MKDQRVTPYARFAKSGRRSYERINRKNPQMGPGIVYCLRYELNGKRVWETHGTNLVAANAAAFRKQSELVLGTAQSNPPKPLPDQPASLERLREEFLSDKKTSRKKNGELRDEDTIRVYEQLARDFLDFIKVKNPALITARLLKAWITSLLHLPEIQPGMENPHPQPIYTSSLTSPGV